MSDESSLLRGFIQPAVIPVRYLSECVLLGEKSGEYLPYFDSRGYRSRYQYLDVLAPFLLCSNL